MHGSHQKTVRSVQHESHLFTIRIGHHAQGNIRNGPGKAINSCTGKEGILAPLIFVAASIEEYNLRLHIPTEFGATVVPVHWFKPAYIDTVGKDGHLISKTSGQC